MTARPIRAVLALLATVALAACSSSTSGKGSAGSGAPSGMPTDAAGLGQLMQSAVEKITSAHITLDINAAGQALTGSGDEQLTGGKLVALDITENLPGGAGAIRIILVDGKTYAKLPASMNSSGKPYLLVTKDSTNPVIQQLAGSLDSALSSASLGSVSAFILAAKSVTPKGTESIDGVSTTHYSVVVDISKLPSSLPGKDALVSSGLATIPLELYIDSEGRPIQVTEDFEVQGQSVSTKVTVTDYNKPVSIEAPPANQIGS
jgi:hypothetical protein